MKWTAVWLFASAALLLWLDRHGQIRDGETPSMILGGLALGALGTGLLFGAVQTLKRRL